MKAPVRCAQDERCWYIVPRVMGCPEAKLRNNGSMGRDDAGQPTKDTLRDWQLNSGAKSLNSHGKVYCQFAATQVN